jgi:purine catabolism regulator
LSIELAKQCAVTEARLRLQGDLYDDLLTGNFPNEEAMLTRARWVGHDLTRPHVVVALGLSDEGRAVTGPSRRFHAADLLRSSVLRDRSDVLTREHLGTVMVAISQSGESTRESSIELADGLRGALSDSSAGHVATAGVGRAYAGVQGVERATHEAQQALEIARSLGGGGRTLHFEELGILRLLFQLRDNSELVSFFNDLVGKLHAHDERHNTDLVNSLEAFFDCNGNHVRTAQRLHLHRNTLLYRLDRARHVLEVDFDDAETRLALQVALKIGRVIGRRPSA